MKIKSTFLAVGELPSFDESKIKAEPMLHRATREFAEANGGPLTKSFLELLSWQDPIIIDSRVHMLMPGMFPCIPGWHHDDIPRSRSDGQPNYETPEYHSMHCMALWGDCSLTEFAVGEHELIVPPLGVKIYKVLHPHIEQLCESHILRRRTAPERSMIYFNDHAWHRGAEATKKGFRFFIRATTGTHLKPRNEIRYNANVYMPVIEEGW